METPQLTDVTIEEGVPTYHFSDGSTTTDIGAVAELTGGTLVWDPDNLDGSPAGMIFGASEETSPELDAWLAEEHTTEP